MATEGYKIPFYGLSGGKVIVSGDTGDELEFGPVRGMFESFGEIYYLDLEERGVLNVIVCEYFDRRRAIDVIESMNGRDMFVHPQSSPTPYLLHFAYNVLNSFVRILACLFGVILNQSWSEIPALLHLPSQWSV